MSNSVDIYEYTDYKKYLTDFITKQKKITRAAIAELLNCQRSYISQILNSHSHFSSEQIFQIAKYIKLSTEQTKFLVLIFNYNRTAHDGLANLYLKDIKEIKEEQNSIKTVIETTSELSDKDKYQYYSKWWYSAIHILLSIDRYNSFETISERLKLSVETVQEVILFLFETGLVENDSSFYKISDARIHLDKKSPLIAIHHKNWRQRVIESLDRTETNPVNYSSVVSLSQEACEQIKKVIRKSISDSEKALHESDGELELYSLCIDFFKV